MNNKEAGPVLIANRGEIAIRIARAARELGIFTIGIYAEDDDRSLHRFKVDKAIPLKGKGVSAYLDQEQILQIAKKNQCRFLHPGYGFLSENPGFALRCREENMLFIGPEPSVLQVFGNKATARQLAEQHQIPIIPGTVKATSLKEVKAFFKTLEGKTSGVIKAIAGGGGRGMRIVHRESDLEAAYKRCQSEAEKAFGSDEVYIEQILSGVRHIEIQILGDHYGNIIALGERECSLQRQHQKVIEVAPCPGLAPKLRKKLIEAALRLATAVNYTNAGTFEFLVEKSLASEAPFYFLEANPRIQVEHTITEEVTGVDLLKAQFQITQGNSLKDIGLSKEPKTKGVAIQLRINTETIEADGQIKPGVGQITALEFPQGKGIRIESNAYSGYQNSPNYDTLLAKLICYTPESNFENAARKAYQSLCECRIEGVPTNLDLLHNIVRHSQFSKGLWLTRFVEENLKSLVKTQNKHDCYYLPSDSPPGKKSKEEEYAIPDGWLAIRSPMPGTVLQLTVKSGDDITVDQELLIIEAMKMETLVQAKQNGIVREIRVKEGDLLVENQVLILMEQSENLEASTQNMEAIDPDYIRPDLAEVHQRKAFLLDENRPEAVEKRRKSGQYTARENIAALCDPDSFMEYGGLIIAAQRKRRKMDDLLQNTPADGLVSGIGSINGTAFGPERSKCLILAYDYTVLAGTQGTLNHKKMDRLLHLANEWRIPIVVFAEGGGGRPGDVDFPIVAGLDVMTFSLFARMSGMVPRVSIVSRYCFAGNAALAGCADVIIATENTSIGMGGPAMIEGGGLGKFHPKEVGPAKVQAKNGVIDILVRDEMEAVAVAKKYLSYFQGKTEEWNCADQRLLRQSIPENRRRVYDIKALINLLADTDSFLELRAKFALGMITGFARIEGRPIGIIANNPKHLGGAIDSEGADKAARFMQLCDAFGIPILSLCDTPGIMVGPEAEKTATVRHASRLFVIGGSLSVPVFTIVLRKGYGLGAQAMAGGSFHVPAFTIAWPTGEFGAMGLEGAVKLGFRKELEQAGSPEEQQALYEKMVAKAYERGKGLNLASYLEIDDVIDPVDSRKWIINGLDTIPKDKYKSGGNRIVDTW